MKHRISIVTTKTGDLGETSLANGTRVSKDDPRIHALGEIDELNSCIGLLLTEDSHSLMKQNLNQVQQTLFIIGSALASGNQVQHLDKKINELEKTIHSENETLPPLSEFILPGGTRLASMCHLARCVCRRTERHTVTLIKQQYLQTEVLTYLNRLSDLLFICARRANHQAGYADILWEKN